MKLKKSSATTSNIKNYFKRNFIQDFDKGNFAEWKEVGGRNSSEEEKEDLIFANLVCKHLKSNAIAIVKNKQLYR